MGERKQPSRFDDRCHVGVDGMIFDNRNEMEVVTKIRQKPRRCPDRDNDEGVLVFWARASKEELKRERESLWEDGSRNSRRSLPAPIISEHGRALGSG